MERAPFGRCDVAYLDACTGWERLRNGADKAFNMAADGGGIESPAG